MVGYRRARAWPWLVLCTLAPLAAVSASDLEERLERLEAQMERLIRQLEQQQQPTETQPPAQPLPQAPAEPAEAPAPPPATVAPAVPAQPVAPPAPPAAPAARPGEVRLRYFLESAELGTTPPDTAPMADGLFALEGDLRMDPFRYGAAGRRLVGGYRDPSEYRAVGILLEGRLEIPNAGVHRFEVTPKPAREGGGSPVANEMTVHLWVAGEPVVALEGVRTWRRRTVERTLPAGSHSFRLWVVANSPDYGPAPIDSRLGMEVVMPGRAEVTPLWRLMSAPGTP
jgi:hypothetical protein